ncbi:glycosyltransferase [Algoriphagus kandeliae]|uniref:Glycosyltransferase n=1 Tax=Algoriphagus kandeliae TaxID=2562278 RepID=A0A4Y9QYM7_9BACT|nr:glycosyltransferase [Algoriphagus kandeliae]TFV97197.1 glycosyltransferase [Algoriphagus kandeliae]
MSDKPLVSVSCITYNHFPYIRQCFEGILKQKVNFRFEIIVYDDASNDGTSDVIREFESKYPSTFKVLIQEENQYSKGVRGIAVRYNFPRCEGKYIAFCEGDDFWTDPYKLQKQVDFLEANPSYSTCCTNYSEVDEDGKILKTNAWDGIRLSSIISHEVILEKYKPKILTTLFRKEAFKKGFPEIFFEVFNADNFLSALATEHGPVGFLNFNSGCYRIHNSGIWSGKNLIQQFENQLDTFEKMKLYFLKDFQQIAISNRIYHIRRRLSRLYAKEKDFGKSLSQMKHMVKVNPIDSSKVFLGNLIAPFR